MSTTLISEPPASAAAVNQNGSMTALIAGILDDGQRLLKQQLDMLRAEVREDIRKTRDIVFYLGLGVGLAAVGGVMLLVALVYLVNYLTGWHLAGCWAAVGGATVALGAAAFAAGGRIMASYNPLPDKSLNALQENVSWIANPRPQT